jgi:hypothetical protein
MNQKKTYVNNKRKKTYFFGLRPEMSPGMTSTEKLVSHCSAPSFLEKQEQRIELLQYLHPPCKQAQA